MPMIGRWRMHWREDESFDMIKPKALKGGDTVGVVAPSDAVEKAGMEESLEVIKSWGLKVKMGKHVYSKVGDFAAVSIPI